MLQEQRGVCVTTALTGTGTGEASSIVFILPLFVSPALPLWPLLPDLILLWAQKLWQENEMGTNRSGEKDLPRHPVASVSLSGGVGCYQFCPVLPGAGVRCLGACSPSGKM